MQGGGGCSQLGLVARFGVAGAQLVAAAALAAVAIVGHVGQRVGADQVPAGHSTVTPVGPPPTSIPPVPQWQEGAVQPLNCDLAHPRGRDVRGCPTAFCWDLLLVAGRQLLK